MADRCYDRPPYFVRLLAKKEFIMGSLVTILNISQESSIDSLSDDGDAALAQLRTADVNHVHEITQDQDELNQIDTGNELVGDTTDVISDVSEVTTRIVRDTGSISPEGYKMLNVTLEALRSTVFLSTLHSSISLESYQLATDTQRGAIALEGVKDTLKGLWDKFIAFLKSAWNRLKEFVATLFNVEKRMLKRLEIAKNILYHAKDHQIPTEKIKLGAMVKAIGPSGMRLVDGDASKFTKVMALELNVSRHFLVTSDNTFKRISESTSNWQEQVVVDDILKMLKSAPEGSVIGVGGDELLGITTFKETAKRYREAALAAKSIDERSTKAVPLIGHLKFVPSKGEFNEELKGEIESKDLVNLLQDFEKFFKYMVKENSLYQSQLHDFVKQMELNKKKLDLANGKMTPEEYEKYENDLTIPENMIKANQAMYDWLRVLSPKDVVKPAINAGLGLADLIISGVDKEAREKYAKELSKSTDIAIV